MLWEEILVRESCERIFKIHSLEANILPRSRAVVGN